MVIGVLLNTDHDETDPSMEHILDEFPKDHEEVLLVN